MFAVESQYQDHDVYIRFIFLEQMCETCRPATSACQRVSFTRSTRGPVSVSAIPRTTVVDTPNETVEQLERSLQLGSEPAG